MSVTDFHFRVNNAPADDDGNDQAEEVLGWNGGYRKWTVQARRPQGGGGRGTVIWCGQEATD